MSYTPHSHLSNDYLIFLGKNEHQWHGRHLKEGQKENNMQ